MATRMHIHILGICGTFMGGIAALAKADGHVVTGCDANVYPPMSTQLEALGIALIEGFDPAQLGDIKPDLFVIGNVITRGNPLMEEIMNRGLPYVSGPDWLSRNLAQTPLTSGCSQRALRLQLCSACCRRLWILRSCRPQRR